MDLKFSENGSGYQHGYFQGLWIFLCDVRNRYTAGLCVVDRIMELCADIQDQAVDQFAICFKIMPEMLFYLEKSLVDEFYECIIDNGSDVLLVNRDDVGLHQNLGELHNL